MTATTGAIMTIGKTPNSAPNIIKTPATINAAKIPKDSLQLLFSICYSDKMLLLIR